MTLERDLDIYKQRQEGVPTAEVARQYGITKGRVSQIVRGIASAELMATKQDLKVGKGDLFKEFGVSGLKRWGGYVDEEFLTALRGDKGRKLYREMRENHPVIGAVFFAIEMALRKVKFKAEMPGKKQDEATEFVEQCLEDMSNTWNDTLSQILTMLQYGWSAFELVYKVRRGQQDEAESRFNDGKIGWRKWLEIAQDTLAMGDEWIFDDAGGIQGLNQCAPPKYIKTTIPIEKLLLFRTSIAKNNPEGKSLLRNLYQPWYYSKNLAEIEAIAAERLSCGYPVCYMGDDTKKDPNVTGGDFQLAQQMVRDARTDEQAGIVIPYPKMGGGAAEGKGMLFEFVSPSGEGKVDFAQVIERYDKRIAMACLAQFIMLGMEQTGSYALSKDQSDLFNLALTSWAESIAQVITRYAIPRLFKLNTFGVKELPVITHSEVGTPDLEAVAQFINQLVGANVIEPDDNLEQYLRQLGSLPEKGIPRIGAAQQAQLELQQRELEAKEQQGEQPDENETKDETKLEDDKATSGKSEAEKEKASERFTITQSRRARGGARYETATNAYQATLENNYTEWYTKLAKQLANADEDRDEVLLAALTAYEKQMKDAGRQGLLQAMQLGAAGQPLSPDGVAKLSDAIQENDNFIENSLIPAIKTKLQQGFADPLIAGEAIALSGILQSFVPRVASYAGGYWQALHLGIGDYVSQQSNDLAVEIVLDPAAQHCDDCPRLAKVYRNWDEMMAESGIPATIGRARCGANCRCVVRIETAPSSGVFERL